MKLLESSDQGVTVSTYLDGPLGVSSAEQLVHQESRLGQSGACGPQCCQAW